VAILTHPSIADRTNPKSDPTGLVRELVSKVVPQAANLTQNSRKGFWENLGNGLSR